MLKTTPKPTLGKPNPIPTPQQELFDKYAAYARRVRDLEEETVNQQQVYINRFLIGQNIWSPDQLFRQLTPACVQEFVFDYANDYGPGSQQKMQAASVFLVSEDTAAINSKLNGTAIAGSLRRIDTTLNMNRIWVPSDLLTKYLLRRKYLCTVQHLYLL